MAIEDRIARGAAAGTLGTIPGLLFNWACVSLGLAKFFSFQLTGSVFLFPGLTDSVQGMILGGMIWLFIGAFGGILVAYLVSKTGTDYWWLKSMGVSVGVIYIGLYGFMYTQGAARIVPFDFATNMTELIGNVVYGLAMGYLVIRFSPDSITE